VKFHLIASEPSRPGLLLEDRRAIGVRAVHLDLREHRNFTSYFVWQKLRISSLVPGSW